MIHFHQLLIRCEKKWNEYWYREASSIGYAFFRIGFGLVLLFLHIPRLWYIAELYTSEGFLYPMRQFTLLHLPIPSFFAAAILNGILILAIICFTVGYRTKISTAIVLLLHLYLTMLERFSTKGYGAIISIYLFLLLFAPSGSFLSIDYLRNRMRQWVSGIMDMRGVRPPRTRVTLQRVMLWQLSFIYFFNVVAKLSSGGLGWFTGVHVARIYEDTDMFARPFASAIFAHMGWLTPLMGFGIMGMLFFISIGLLRREEQMYAIMFGVGYHSFSLFTTTVPFVFSLLMFSLYLIAIDPDRWDAWWRRLQNYYAKKRAKLFYDDGCGLCQRTVAFIRAVDVFDRIQYIGLSTISDSQVVIGGRAVDRDMLYQEMHFVSPDGSLSKGFLAYRALARMFLLFLPAVPFLYFPGVRWAGDKIYAFIAKRRKNVCRIQV